MSQVGETGEVIRTHVHGLEERRRCVDISFGFEDAPDFLGDPSWASNVFKDRDSKHHIELCVGKGQVMSVGDQRHPLE